MSNLHTSLVDLELPRRVKNLPVDSRGFPVPFFVAVVNGQPDHRIVDPDKVVRCINSSLCWICGQPLGRNVAFVIGALGILQRLSSEPPSHRDCAEFAVMACPHIARPHAKNRPVDHNTGLTRELPINTTDTRFGIHAVWVTRIWEWRWRTSGVGMAYLYEEPEVVTVYRERKVVTEETLLATMDDASVFLLEWYRQKGGDLSKVIQMCEKAVKTLGL